MELKNVSFAYKSSQTPVLHDINLVLEEPGLYCIVGPNGVGKSTDRKSTRLNSSH